MQVAFGTAKQSPLEGFVYIEKLQDLPADTRHLLFLQAPEDLEELTYFLTRKKYEQVTFCSRIEVFAHPYKVDEADFPFSKTPLGLHYREAEKTIKITQPHALIARLAWSWEQDIFWDSLGDPLLFMQHYGQYAQVQFYRWHRLAHDLQIARGNGIDCIHLVYEPIPMQLLCAHLDIPCPAPQERAIEYDVQTRFGDYFGTKSRYLSDLSSQIRALEEKKNA